jgi:hypothetical protein
MSIRTIKFTKNWNGKLFQNNYTTIRSYHIDRDTLVDIELKGAFHHQARVVESLTCKIKDIPEWVYLLDTGLGRIEAEKLILQLSKKTQEDAIFILVLQKTPQYLDKSF